MFRCERQYITFVFPHVADVCIYLEQLTESYSFVRHSIYSLVSLVILTVLVVFMTGFSGYFVYLHFAYVINVVTVITWLGSFIGGWVPGL